jgi:hypothetical protein
MRDFGVIFEKVPLMYDNTSVISVAKNPVIHKRIRHLKRRYHCLRDQLPIWREAMPHPLASLSTDD